MDSVNGFKKSSYTIKGGRKFRDDTIYCFVSENNKWGVMKMNEFNIYEELLPPIYDSTGYEVSQDLIVAVNYIEGMYSPEGNTHILFKINGDQVGAIENIDHLIFEKKGNVFVVKNGKYGVLDENFKTEIPCEYHLLTSLSKDIFAFEKLSLNESEKNEEDYENGCGIINRKNEIIESFYFTFRVYPHLYHNTVIIGTDDGFLIDKEYFAFNIVTKIKTPLGFEKIFDTQPYHYHFNSQPLFRTVTEIVPDFVNYKMDTWETDNYVVGKWGVIFPNGKVAIPNEYDYIERISPNYYKFCIGVPVVEENIEDDKLFLKKVKWGLTDNKNQIILEPEFDWITMNKDRGTITTNKGGIVFWDENEHRPEWQIHGGVFEELKPE